MEQPMTETVLVTGASGFIAGWCILELLKRGYRVRTTLRDLGKAAAVRAAIVTETEADDRLEFVAADLTDDSGWDSAMAGCTYVLHVASPLGNEAFRNAGELLAPARDGTLRVLGAAVRAGVRRVVMTSAAAAARARRDTEWVSDESVWPVQADAPDPYRRSKILAERAAWDFMAHSGGTTAFTTILPVAVFGPPLMREKLGSVQVVQRLLTGQLPAIPRLGFSIVDVRDLAVLHVTAMTAPQAAGERFIAGGEFMWLADIAQTLRSGVGIDARKVPTRAMPDFVFKLLARVVPPLRMLTEDLGRVNHPSAQKARRQLGFSPRPAATTVLDCARCLTGA